MAWSAKILPHSRLILGDVGDVVEDQQLVLVELGDGGFEPQLPARHLQPLDEVGGADEQHAPAVFWTRASLPSRSCFGQGFERCFVLPSTAARPHSTKAS
jgi:hypothetical protein